MAAAPSLDLLLGLAFGAGALAFFSPCTVAMLPAYMAYYLRGWTREPAEGSFPLPVAANGGGPRWVVPASALAFAGAGALLLIAFVNSLRQDIPGFARSELPLSASGLILLVAGVVLLVYGLRSGLQFGELRQGMARGLAVGAITSLGIATVLASLGLLILGGASYIQRYLPEAVIATAGALVILGILMFLGRAPSFIPSVKAPRGGGLLSFYTFGLGYALVSTGCNLPVFLLVTGLALQAATTSLTGALLVFVAYTGGSSVVLMLMTTYLAIAQRSSLPWLHRVLPHIERAAGIVVVAVGAYILWYDYAFVLRQRP